MAALGDRRRVIAVCRYKEYPDGIIVETVTAGGFGEAPVKIPEDTSLVSNDFEAYTLAKGAGWRIRLIVEYDEGGTDEP